MTAKKILLIATSCGRMGKTDRRTGVWLEEFATPYRILSGAGFAIDTATPLGGAIPIDPESLKKGAAEPESFAFFQEKRELFESARKLSDFSAEAYDAVFYPGGHGPMWDLASDAANARILEAFFAAEKLICAVCHGPAALLGARRSDGASVLLARRVTGFSNAEEQSLGLSETVPFSLEARLKNAGASYSCKPPWHDYAVSDGNLITGQNPQSAASVAQLLKMKLRKRTPDFAARTH